MNDYFEDEMIPPDASPGSRHAWDAKDIINTAIEWAADRTHDGHGTGSTDKDGSLPPAHSLLPTDDALPYDRVDLPRDADAILLDLLPVSLVLSDESGRPQIEPDTRSMASWEKSDRGTAEHLVSWINETGTVRDAIEMAIKGGLDKFDRLAAEYDEKLARAEYDRSAPEVQACSSELVALHDVTQHARDILADLDAPVRQPHMTVLR